MSVEVLAGSVVAHGGAGVGVAGGDLDVAEVDAGVEHGGDVGVAEHVGVHPRASSRRRSSARRGGGGWRTWRSIRLPARLRRIGPPARPPTARSMARPTAGGSGTSDDLVALAVDAQDAVAVDLAEALDVGAGGLEDPQPEEAEHRDQGEVVEVGGVRGRR